MLLNIDDSWINITPEQLDEMLNNAYGRYAAPASDMDKVAERMKTFVDKMSSHEGVEFPGSVLFITILIQAFVW
jgi:SGT1 protein